MQKNQKINIGNIITDDKRLKNIYIDFLWTSLIFAVFGVSVRVNLSKNDKIPVF
jgi:hypothetical protein